MKAMKLWRGIIVLLVGTACSFVVRAQIITNSDTTNKTDVSTKDFITLVKKQTKHFSTFTARIKIDYQDERTQQDATCYLTMKKDSFVAMTIAGAMGIIGAQIYITPDTIIVVNQLKKTIQYHSFKYLQQRLNFPNLNLCLMQNLLMGNPPILEDTGVYRSYDETGRTWLQFQNNTLQYRLQFDTTDFPALLRFQAKELSPQKLGIYEMIYDNYVAKHKMNFPVDRTLLVHTEKINAVIKLNFKKCSFNGPVHTQFAIPKNFTTLPAQ